MLMSRRLNRCHRYISHPLSVWTKMSIIVGRAHCAEEVLGWDRNRKQVLQLRLGKGLARPSTRPRTSSWKLELILLRIKSVSEGWVWRSVLSSKTASSRNTTISTLIKTSMVNHRSRHSSSSSKKKSSKRPSSWDSAGSCTHGTVNLSKKERST